MSHRILIIGPGAVGGLFGVRLAAAGMTVSFAARNQEMARCLNRKGVTLLDASGATHGVVRGFPLQRLPGDADLLIITVKIYDLVSICKRISALLERVPAIVLVQSSLQLKDLVPAPLRQKTMAASLMIGVAGAASDVVVETGPGSMSLGPLCNNKGDLSLVSETAGVLRNVAKVKMSHSITGALFSKVAFNVATVPFCVAAGASFGKTFARSQKAVNYAAHILQECARVGICCREIRHGRMGPVAVSDVAADIEAARESIAWLVSRFPNVMPSAVFDAMRQHPTELPFFFRDIEILGQGRPALLVRIKAIRDIVEMRLAKEQSFGPSLLSGMLAGLDDMNWKT
ncbi:MAG: hypothetical protein LLG01_15880 [Planctomycetaceae bacterium]|nr:hypothetical protein [Planctomycetaceae bacterium]